MGVLGGGQLQSAGDRLQDRGGGADVATLLEPGVPGGSHAGELGDLLAAQAGCTAAAAARKADVLGADRLAPVAQEVGELGAPGGAIAVRDALGWCF